MPIDSLPGIDLQGFLSRFDGNFALLASLLPRFVEASEARNALVAQHLQTGNQAELAAVLHQIRGAAANVGANDMANIAGRAEDMLARGDIEALRPLPDALTKIMVRLREAAAIVAALPPEPENAQENRAPIPLLLEMLRTHNMRALDVIADCTAYLTTALGPADAETAISAVRALNFDEAYGKLARLRPGGTA